MGNQEEPLFALIIPSLASVLCWLEATLGAPLSEEDVQYIAKVSPAVTMAASMRAPFEEARSYADIDPESAWDQWQYLRKQIERQGVALSTAFPLPRAQLASDLRILRQIGTTSGLLKPEEVEHQLIVLADLADKYLSAFEGELKAK
jgi:hypothetical protein